LQRAWPGGIGPLPGGLTSYCPSVLDRRIEEIVPGMTYKVFGGTLNPTLLLLYIQSSASLSIFCQHLKNICFISPFLTCCYNSTVSIDYASVDFVITFILATLKYYDWHWHYSTIHLVTIYNHTMSGTVILIDYKALRKFKPHCIQHLWFVLNYGALYKSIYLLTQEQKEFFLDSQHIFTVCSNKLILITTFKHRLLYFVLFLAIYYMYTINH